VVQQIFVLVEVAVVLVLLAVPEFPQEQEMVVQEY